MPVRVPDLGDRPAAPLGLGEDRRSIAGIDDRRLAARLVVDEPEIIVGEGRDRDDLHRRALYAPPGEDRQRIGGELARELGGGKRLAERSRLARPHRAEAIFALLFRSDADRSERGACERVGRRFGVAPGQARRSRRPRTPRARPPVKRFVNRVRPSFSRSRCVSLIGVSGAWR